MLKIQSRIFIHKLVLYRLTFWAEVQNIFATKNTCIQRADYNIVPGSNELIIHSSLIIKFLQFR
jgi:hypothetical protein